MFNHRISDEYCFGVVFKEECHSILFRYVYSSLFGLIKKIGIQKIAFHALDDLMKECGTLSEIIIDTKSQITKSDFFSSIQFRFSDIENTLIKRKKK